ncbi:MAG: hypothetical protein AB7K67_02045 [Hyphomicrobiaceae bacterium]|jgi:hypothetical protein
MQLGSQEFDTYVNNLRRILTADAAERQLAASRPRAGGLVANPYVFGVVRSTCFDYQNGRVTLASGIAA